MTTRSCFLYALVILINACNQPPGKYAYDPGAFHAMLDSYWRDYCRLNPLEATSFGDSSYNDQIQNTCTQAFRNEVKSFYLRYEDSLKNFDPAVMDESDRLSYQILDYDLKNELEGLKFDTWKIPFTQMGDAGNTISSNLLMAIGQFGSGESAQPFKTVRDYDNWLKRAHGYVAWCDSAIGNFRLGMATNYVLPHALVVKMVDVCNGLINPDITKNIFYGPIKNMPAEFSPADRQRLTGEYISLIKDELNPAHERLSKFLSEEYLPRSRSTSGVDALPDGKAYYAYCVRSWTTTNKTPDEIYNLGLSEVKRIRGEMESVKNSTGFKGDLNSFFEFMRTNRQFMPFKTPDQVLDSFRHIYAIIKPNLPRFFIVFPKSKFEIRQTEAFRAASASIEYMQGSPDGSRPGIFYVPILDATKFNITSGMESTFLHEAIPGHHYQCSLQMEDTALPLFRRFKWYGAYGEGWALYAESLGKELGLYTNPYQHMGALGDEIHRAIRLVVDVGIHSRGMTREQAIGYMMENEAVSRESAVAEIERYMAMPGQALSYKIGALKIKELRDRLAAKQGGAFSIGEFHKKVLDGGCVPLSILEEKILK